MDNPEAKHNRTAPGAASTSGRPPAETWWEVFVHAVKGTGGDPTAGPLRRAVILLAIPMVLEMVMESLFAVVDIFFVSRLGDQAMAGVALTESVLALIYTAAIGLSIGVTAMVARRTGEGDREGAARGAAQAIFLGVAMAIAFGVAGVIFAADILRLMGADEAVVAMGLPYTQIMLGDGSPKARITAENRLTAYRAARSAFSAVGLDTTGPCRESGKSGPEWRESARTGAVLFHQALDECLLRSGGPLGT